MIRVRGLQPLSVGVVSHHDGRPHLGVVVKTAFAMPPPGATRAEMLPPPPMRGDEPVAWPGLGATELAHASDLAPRKARADVLLVGHASAAEPATALPIRFAIGPVRRELVAVASAPATDLPLVAEHLRVHPPSEPTVGPQRAAGARLRRPRRAGRAEAPWGAWMIDLATAEDGSGYQAAPPEQQVPLPFPTAAQIVLSGLGLGAGGVERWFWLPPVAPFAFVIAADAAHPVGLACDTVVVDVDAGVVTLLHRGRWSGPVVDVELLVGLHGRGAPREAAEALALRASALPLPHVTIGPGGEPLPVVAAEPRDEPSHDAGFGGGREATAAIDVRRIAASLPFDGPPAPPSAPAVAARRPPSDDADDDGGPSTAMVDVSRLGPSLPFGSSPGAEAPRAEITAALPVADLAGFDEAPGQTRPIPVVPTPEAPLVAAAPAASSSPLPSSPLPSSPLPSSPLPSSPLTPASSPWVATVTPPPVPAAPVAPPPSSRAGAPRDAEQPPIGRAPLTLDELADVQVELEDSPRAQRRAVLARHQLDPVAWAQEQARWAAKLEAEAAQGDSRTLDALLARARTRRAQAGDGAA